MRIRRSREPGFGCWPRRLVAGLCLLIWVALSAPSRAAEPTLNLAEYRASLDAIVANIDDSRGEATVPLAWHVRSGDRDLDVPTFDVSRDLRAWRKDRDEAARARVLARVALLKSEAAAFEQPPTDRAAERQRLTAILATREFANVSSPSALDRLKQALADLLIRLIDVIAPGSSFPTLSRVVVYGLVTIATILLAWSAYKYLRASGQLEPIVALHAPPPPREWAVWFRDAEAAADRHDWRQALHLAYWCAVAFLETRGAWRPDTARTPREYLRLLPARTPEHMTLAELTSSFEHVWYGNRDADEQMFVNARAHLKKLGCPLA